MPKNFDPVPEGVDWKSMVVGSQAEELTYDKIMAAWEKVNSQPMYVKADHPMYQSITYTAIPAQMIANQIKYTFDTYKSNMMYVPGNSQNVDSFYHETVRNDAVEWVEENAEAMADLVRAAHDVLLLDGWIKGALHRSGQGHCTLGALEKASGQVNGEIDTHALHYLGIWLAIKMTDSINIPTWNDAEDRSEDDVLDMLMNAEKKLREIAGAVDDPAAS